MNALQVATILCTVGFGAELLASPDAAYLSPLNIDDSFYYLVIARNASHAMFSTFDGSGLTNGYHPLWALILTPVFLVIPDPFMALRAAKLMEIGMLAAASLLVQSVACKARWPSLLAMTFPILALSTPVLYEGMEVSIQMLLIAALMYGLAVLFMEGARASTLGVIAMVCVLLPWARLECIVISILVLIVVSVRLGRVGRARSPPLLCAWLAMLLSVLIYFLYNRLVFGQPVPISGVVKAYWSGLRFAKAGDHYLEDNLRRYLLAHAGRLAVVFLTVLLVVLSWLFRPYRSSAMSAEHGLDAFILILAAAYVARLSIAVLTIDDVYDNAYYYVAQLFLGAISIAFIAARLMLLVRISGLGGHLRDPAAVAVAAAVLFTVGWRTQPWRLPLQWGAKTHAINWQDASFDGALWMNRHLPRDAVVGSVDAGVLGYFTVARVVNLDGLVNSTSYFRALEAQAAEGWIRRAGITYLANAVRAGPEDGCGFIAAGAAQNRPFTGCKLLYDGLEFTQSWEGHRDRMRFRVYALSPSDRRQPTVRPGGRPVPARP